MLVFKSIKNLRDSDLKKKFRLLNKLSVNCFEQTFNVILFNKTNFYLIKLTFFY